MAANYHSPGHLPTPTRVAVVFSSSTAPAVQLGELSFPEDEPCNTLASQFLHVLTSEECALWRYLGFTVLLCTTSKISLADSSLL